MVKYKIVARLSIEIEDDIKFIRSNILPIAKIKIATAYTFNAKMLPSILVNINPKAAS